MYRSTGVARTCARRDSLSNHWGLRGEGAEPALAEPCGSESFVIQPCEAIEGAKHVAPNVKVDNHTTYFSSSHSLPGQTIIHLQSISNHNNHPASRSYERPMLC